MNLQLGSVSLTLLIYFAIVSCDGPCFDSTTAHYEGETWIYNDNLNVVCVNGAIVPLNCVTKSGTKIPLGTAEFSENNVVYSCLLDGVANDSPAEGSGEGSGEGELLELDEKKPDCSPITVGLEWNDDNGFRYRCAEQGTTKIVGCVAVSGETVADNQAFVVDNGALKICRIGKNGDEARIENKGCYTGTGNPNNIDVNGSGNHKKKYSTWRDGDIEYRCGDQGIRIHRCFYENKGKQRAVYSGFVWLDSKGVTQFCG